MKQNWYMNMITWREHHIKQKHFILLLSFFVGIGAALAAVILKEAIHLIQYMLTSFFKEGEANYWYLAYPFIGIVCHDSGYIIGRTVVHYHQLEVGDCLGQNAFN